MNKYHLNNIIKILTLPFVQEEILTHDYINKYNCAYGLVLNHVNDDYIERENAEIEYQRTKRKLQQQLNKLMYTSMSIDSQFLTFDMFYPKEIIVKYINRELPIEIYYWKIMEDISNSLLTFRDGKISIRTWEISEDMDGKKDIFSSHNTFDKVEIWNILNRQMTIDIYIVSFYLLSNLKNEKYLYYQTGNISLADKIINGILEKGVAENHIHFNVGLSYIQLWEYRMNEMVVQDGSQRTDIYKKKDQILLCALFRIIISDFLSQQKEESFIKYWIKQGEIGKKVLDIMNYMHDYKECLDYKSLERKFDKVCEWIKGKYQIKDNSDYLLEYILREYKPLKISSEMAFLFNTMRYLKIEQENNAKSENYAYIIKLFFQYIRMKNIFFQYIMQGNEKEGLKYFKGYYDNIRKESKRIYDKILYKNIFKNQAQSLNLKKLELRIAPYIDMKQPYKRKEDIEVKNEIKRNILRQIRIVLEAYKDYIFEMSNIDGKEHSLEEVKKDADQLYKKGLFSVPTIGIVFHFIKRDFIDNITGNMCWVKFYTDNEQSVNSKHIIIYRKKMEQFARMLEELRSEIPILAEYVVGIDAASDEVEIEPWIMAPVYTQIRNKKITKPFAFGNDNEFHRIKNMGFTYHVGEEFRHILSGLRHIDEILEYFKYKPADRLGHALALGVNIDYWIMNHEVITIPIQEYLDNLLWLWGAIVYKKYNFKYSVDELEGKIMICAKKIYDVTYGMTIDMLYDAYKRRFLCNHDKMFEELRNEIRVDTEENNKYFCKFYREPKGHVQWTSDKILCTFYCPVYQKRLRKPEFIKIEKNNRDFYKDVQKQIVEKIEKMGIYVETNPTSNLAIGSIESIVSHPIFNLNSKGLKNNKVDENEHCVLVTINSDDPIIFNTNNENELSYIYHALVQKGYQKEKVIQWIDKVRQMGLDSSFIGKIKLPSEILDDIDGLLRMINDRLGEDVE